MDGASQIDEVHNSLLPKQRRNETTLSTYAAPLISVLQTKSYDGDNGWFPWHSQPVTMPHASRETLGQEMRILYMERRWVEELERPGEGKYILFLFWRTFFLFPRPSTRRSLLSLIVNSHINHVVLYIRSSHSFTCSTCAAQHPRESSCKLPSLLYTSLIVVCRASNTSEPRQTTQNSPTPHTYPHSQTPPTLGRLHPETHKRLAALAGGKIWYGTKTDWNSGTP